MPGQPKVRPGKHTQTPIYLYTRLLRCRIGCVTRCRSRRFTTGEEQRESVEERAHKEADHKPQAATGKDTDC